MRKTSKRLMALFVVLLVMVSGSAVAYADTYHGLRDDNIDLLLPDSWECEEVDKFTSEGESYEWIAETHEGISDDSELWMDLYYMHDIISETEAYSITELEKAKVYFDSYGKAAIETLYSELNWGESVKIGEPSFYEGEMSSQFIVPVEGDYGDGTVFHHLIYLDCETNFDFNNDSGRAVVHMIKMFYRSDEFPMDEADMKTAESIADNCCDYGYYEDGYFGKGDGIGSGIFDFISIVLPLLVVIPGIIAAGAKKLPDLLDRKPTKPKKVKPIPMPAEKRSSEKKATDRALIKKPVESNMPRKAMTSEERYLQSLHTLRKSGLLTREEMADMLERHERNRSSRRRN